MAAAADTRLDAPLAMDVALRSRRRTSFTGASALASLPPALTVADLPQAFRRLSHEPVAAAAQPVANGQLRITASGPAGARAPAIGWAMDSERARQIIARLSLAPFRSGAIVFFGILAFFYWRALTHVSLESDSAMHVHFMKVIADTAHLPTHVPNLAAVVTDGGNVVAYLPYQYTPLYHVLGAMLYSVGGLPAILLMGPAFGAVLALVVFRMTAGSVPWPFAIVAVVLAFLSRTALGVFTWVFMEPMMLAFFFCGLWFYRRLWLEGNRRDALIAGVFLGLAISTRQIALAYLMFVCAHATLLLSLRAWRSEGRLETLRKQGANHALMVLVALTVAAPAMAYLLWNTGSLGYGKNTLPFLHPSLPIDQVASDYISSITTPDASPIDWANRFRRILIPISDWAPGILAYQPVLLYLLGTAYLLTRNKMKHSFLATYALVHLLGELAIYLTYHGNPRYLLATRFLFYPIVAVGLFSVYEATRNSIREGPFMRTAIAVAVVISVTAPFATPGFIRSLVGFDLPRKERGVSYEEAGAWVQANTPADSLFLSARTYESAWYFERNVAYVTDYGNEWAVDAAYATDPATARAILDRYGVDYVVMQNPPGVYVDRMPANGLRHIVLVDSAHFKRVYTNQGIRIYQFLPNGES